MDSTRISKFNLSAYQGCCILLTTKHAKSIAIAPPFQDILGANILEHVADTDELGTFSGEVERKGTSLDCARSKCEWVFNKFGNNIDFALSSEGSFGPHPFIPLVSCDQEIIYFIDRKHDFHLHLSCISEKTNYCMQLIDSTEELQEFANRALFPSHGLILRPTHREEKKIIFKGLNSYQDLKNAFEECMKHSLNKKVWVETDMRAQFNPSRMRVIQDLATTLARRLKSHCPKCNFPGWGKIRQEKGLKCGWCGSTTELIQSEILGCVKCNYEEKIERLDGLKQADPANCEHCNP